MSVIPIISNLSREDIEKLEDSCESHEVPFSSMSVDAFHKGALIREACAQYWEPNYKGRALFYLFREVAPEGLLVSRPHAKNCDFLIEIKIILTYPLQHVWELNTSIPANRLGSIFSIAHDMYKYIYDLDQASWKKDGVEGEIPRAHPKLLNRDAGEYVWGHDMSDLVFEGVYFMPNPDLPMQGKIKTRFIHIENDENIHEADLLEGNIPKILEDDSVLPEIESIHEPLNIENIREGKIPFIGTFTFGIGS